jgi:hypothetical protein
MATLLLAILVAPLPLTLAMTAWGLLYVREPAPAKLRRPLRLPRAKRV